MARHHSPLVRRALLALLVLGSVLPASAGAVPRLIGGGQFGVATTVGGAAPVTVDASPNQVWVVVLSTQQGADVTHVTAGGVPMVLRHQEAGAGARTEIWALPVAAPAAGVVNISYVMSTYSPLRFSFMAFDQVHRTTPYRGAVGSSSSGVATSAELALPGAGATDVLIGALTGANAANMTGLVAVAGQRWSDSGSSITSPLTVSGAALTATSVGWTWLAPNPASPSPYAAAALGLRAPDAPSLATPAVGALVSNAATIGGNITADGGGDVTERGVVYCAGCANPAIGGAGVTQRAGASGGTGTFSLGLTGLTASTTYTVRAYGTNSGATGYSAPVTFTTPGNAPPTVSPGGPYVTTEGSALSLHATGTDADGDPLTYVWDVNGDGTFGDAFGASPTVPWAVLAALGIDGPTVRNVRVYVSDGRNDAATSLTTTLTVSNAAPTATLSAPAQVDEGGSATVSLTGVADASADTAAGLRYDFDVDDDGSWDIGDGTYAAGTSASSHAIAAARLADGPATLNVRARVMDKDGGRSTYTGTVQVRNVAPTATIDPPAVTSREVELRVALADVGDDALAGELDWGDGTKQPLTGSGAQTVTHTYASSGEKTVSLVATDADGDASQAATQTFTIPAPPAPLPSAAPAPAPTPSKPQQTIALRFTSRCLKGAAAGLTRVRVPLTLGQPGEVRLSLERLAGRGKAKCPREARFPFVGPKPKATKIPVRQPVRKLAAGRRTLDVVPTRGKRVRPGSYLLTVTSGDVQVRTKLWVLEPR